MKRLLLLAFVPSLAFANQVELNPAYNTVKPQPSAVTGSTTAFTAGTTSAQVLPAATRQFVAIDNESTTVTIACRFGGTPAINSAGSFTIAPLQTRTWDKYPVPADALNCVAASANTPITVETY